jgi:hypothetical protein
MMTMALSHYKVFQDPCIIQKKVKTIISDFYQSRIYAVKSG